MGPWGLVLFLLVSLVDQDRAAATPLHVDQSDAAAPRHPDPLPAVPQQSADPTSVAPQESSATPHVSTTYTPTPSTALHIQSQAHNGVHHPSSGFVTTAHPTKPPNDVREAHTAAPQKSEPAGQEPAVEGRQRYPGYHRPYHRPGYDRPYHRPGYDRPYHRPGYDRPYHRPGGGGFNRPPYRPNRPYRPYRPYLREYLVEPEFEPYGEPYYRRASNIGRVLDAFLRVVTRIVSTGKPGTVKDKTGPSTNGTGSTGPGGSEVTSTGPPPVDSGGDLTATPPAAQSAPQESVFYSVRSAVGGPLKFLVAVAEVPAAVPAPMGPLYDKQSWGSQPQAPKPDDKLVGDVGDIGSPIFPTLDEDQEEDDDGEPASFDTHPPVYHL